MACANNAPGARSGSPKKYWSRSASTNRS